MPARCSKRRHSLRSEEHTSELQSLRHLVCRLLLEKKKHRLHRLHRLGIEKVSRRAALVIERLLPRLRRHGIDRLLRAGGVPKSLPHLFFFTEPPTTEIYTLSLHDALPI